MKRVTYISSFSGELSLSEIGTIAEISQRNNARDGLSGALFCFRNIFYQILEGDEAALDRCFARISRDDRHKDIFILHVEHGIAERKYSDWSMKTVILNESTEPLMKPLRNMLDSITSTHNILRRYTPVEVLQDIQAGLNPLLREFRKVKKVVLFSDIFNSTTLTELLDLKQMSSLLDVYYSIANDAILSQGGTISKLTGDGLMAYFDAGREEQAVRAAVKLLNGLHKVRQSSDSHAQWLYAGIGMTFGEVFEGNIGSSQRKDYTLLGDCVNTAARLESLTRKVGRFLVMDQSLATAVKDWFPLTGLGKYQPRGKTGYVRIYSVNLPEVKNEEGADLKAKIVQGLTGEVSLTA